MDGTALYEGYIAKNRENFDRQYGRSQKQGYEVKEVGGEEAADKTV
jgi:hypothetical protein